MDSQEKSAGPPAHPVARTAPLFPAWRRDVQGATRVALYLAVVALPIVALLVGPVPRGGGWGWDFAMGLGFGGLAMLGAQFALTARLHRLAAPFGIDLIYYFHRWAATGAVGLIVAHYLIIRHRYPAALGPADPLTAPVHLTAGRISLGLFLVLIVTSLARKQLRIPYDRWRLAHGLMAVAAVALALVHIEGTGNYTRATWKGALWIGYTSVWVAILMYLRVVRPFRLQRQPYRVTDLTRQGASAWELTVKPEGNWALPFQPGQFAWLSLGRSPFRAEEHPFSFSGSAASPGALRFTIKALGDFTRTIGETKLGTVAYVDGPYGVFTPDLHPGAPGFIFIVGGVGIAPIMSMLRTMVDRGERRPLHLIYGSWRRDDILFREELDRLAAALLLTVTHVLQDPPSGWTGEQGLVTADVLRRRLPPEAATYTAFLCGPRAMTDFVTPSLRRLGVSTRRIHLEHFEMA